MSHLIVLFLTILTSVILWSMIEKKRQALRGVEEYRSRCRRRIAMDPASPEPYLHLGESLQADGRMTEAREVYLRGLDNCHGKEGEAALRDQWDLIERMSPASHPASSRSSAETILCLRCGEANAPQNHYCRNCHQRMAYERFWEALLDKEVQWATAETALCLLVLTGIFWTFEALPIDIKGMLACSTLIVCGWRFLKAIGSPEL